MKKVQKQEGCDSGGTGPPIHIRVNHGTEIDGMEVYWDINFKAYTLVMKFIKLGPKILQPSKTMLPYKDQVF